MKTMKTINIRTLFHCILICCLLSCGTTILTGCADGEHMDEYQVNNNDKEQPEDEPLSDEISKKLESIPGVSDVEIQLSQKDENVRGYYFYVTQLVDHSDPSKGTFGQRCFLSFKGNDSPVVLETEGYHMVDSLDNIFAGDLPVYLNANYLSIEHRYFGKSLPEPYEDLDFTYLYTDQAAADLHAIVTLMQKHLFPRKNKWVATGTSKGGITTTLYAYYSDMYGWDDIDLYVPFCAPFITGTKEACVNDIIGQYILTTCGNGYPKGSIEDEARQRLLAIPAAICTNETLRDACLAKFHVNDPNYYTEIYESYQGEQLEKAATAGVISTFYQNLFDKFSAIQYSRWASYVPDPIKAIVPTATDEDIYNVVDFVFLDNKELEKRINKQTSASLRSVMSDQDLLKMRTEDPTMPYYVQAARELGSYTFNYSMVDGTWLTPQFAYEVGYMECVDSRFCGRYQGQWDGGKLMTDVRNWSLTVSSKPIIFIYSYNDPWTGAAISDSAANPSRKVWKVINLIGTHTPCFLDKSLCDEQASKTIKDAIYTVLGL